MSHNKINIPAYAQGHSALMVPVHELDEFDPTVHLCVQEMVAAKFQQCPTYAGIDGVEKATLVAFRKPGAPGHQGTFVERLVQVSLYFEEVRPFVALADEAIAQRCAFAEATGYILFGRDEAMAIVHATDKGAQFCDCFEVNTDGVARLIQDFYPENVVSKAAPKTIASLHASAAEEAMSNARGNLVFSGGRALSFNQVQTQRYMRTLHLLDAHLPVAPPERTASAAIVTRSFISNGSTDSVSHLRKRSEGWVRYPTRSDAWYYGQWINPKTYQLLSYCEGDVTQIQCESAEQFRAELKALAETFGSRRSPSAIGVGPGETSVMFDTLFLGQGPYKVIRFDTDAPTKDERGRWVAPLFGALYLEHPAVLNATSTGYTKLPAEAFELDQLAPQAHLPYEVYAKSVANGYALTLKLADQAIDALVALQMANQ